MGFNETLFLAFLLLDMCLVVLMYRIFGREGLFGYMVLAIITCNIEVLKQVEMFGFPVTLGNVLYGSIFLTSDIIAEVYGKREARRAVWLGFAAMLLSTLFIQIALHFKPNDYDAAHPHLLALFQFLPRIAVASLLAFLVSQHLDVMLFAFFRQRMQGRALWFRNNASTLISQLVDTVLFTLLAFAPLPLLGSVAGFEDWKVIWGIGVSTYVLKLMVCVMDTPFVYLARTVGLRHHPPTVDDRSHNVLPIS
jgi:uncharacterized integral membrane protein (TIGR00697 family)